MPDWLINFLAKILTLSLIFIGTLSVIVSVFKLDWVYSSLSLIPYIGFLFINTTLTFVICLVLLFMLFRGDFIFSFFRRVVKK